MAYEGEILTEGGSLDFDLNRAEAVGVSGSGPNVCGHLLLYARSSNGGLYFQVATGDRYGGINGFPKYMDANGFARYLKETNKSVLRRVPVPIPHPDAARTHLERLMSERWTWGGLPNNCVAFVEEVIKAGGGTWASASNCPAVAVDHIPHQVNTFFSQLEGQIYRLYGAPGF